VFFQLPGLLLEIVDNDREQNPLMLGRRLTGLVLSSKSRISAQSVISSTSKRRFHKPLPGARG
jgi:hypothetical protein